MSEIRLFAGDFAPKNWAYCLGQQMAVNTNQALFALLGNTYGGNGVTTFQLPNLAGRVPVGTGASTTVSSFNLAQTLGQNQVVCNTLNLPQHTHNPIGETASLKAFSEGGDASVPTNNILASMNGLYTVNQPDTTLKPVFNAFNVNYTGQSQPIDIRQPYLGLNYIICIMGIFPSRN